LSHSKAISAPKLWQQQGQESFLPHTCLWDQPFLSLIIRASTSHLLSHAAKCQSLCSQRECRSGGKQVSGGKIINTHSKEMVRDGFRYPGRMKVKKKETWSPNNCINLRTSQLSSSTLPQNQFLPPPKLFQFCLYHKEVYGS